MGNLADAYKKIIIDKAVIDSEPVPDRVEDSAGFFDYNKRARRAGRKITKARALLSSQDLSFEQVKNALLLAAGDEDAEKRIKDAKASNAYRNRTLQMLNQKHPELVQELGENRMKFANSPVFFKQTTENWLKDGKLTQAELDGPLAKQVLHGLMDLKVSEETAFITVIEESLTPEQKESFLNSLNEIVDVNDYGPGEMTVGTHDERIEFLGANIPAEVTANEEKLAKYRHALDYSKQHLNVPKPEVRDEFWEREKTCQRIEGGIDDKVREQLPAYEDGRFHNIIDEEKTVMGVMTVDEDRKEDLNSIINAPFSYGERTKEGLKLIFEKMDEMHLNDYPYDPTGEDPDKVYALTKINVQKKELENAIAEGDPDKIIAAQEAYEKTVNDMNELYALAKEYLNPNPVQFPGNMDSIRNSGLPFEFTGDIKNTAMINSAFITYKKMKEHNLSADEYLNDPAGLVINGAMGKLKELSFSEVTKNISLEDSIDALTESGKFAKQTLLIDNAVPLYSFGRQLSLPGALEGDQQLNEKNKITSVAVLNALSADIQSEKAKFGYLKGGADDPVTRNLRQRTLQNLIVASDDERNLPSMMAGLPETDHLGRKVGESFDLDSVITRRPVDYTGIMDRAERLMRKANYVIEGEARNLDPDEVLDAIQQTYHQILSLNPQDKDLPAFKRMQEQMRIIPSRLSKDAPEQLKGKINNLSNEYFSQNALDSDKNPGWENKAYAMGFKYAYFLGTNYAMVDSGAAVDEYNIRLGRVHELSEEYIQEEDEPLIENPRYDIMGNDHISPPLRTENSSLRLGAPIAGSEAERAYKNVKKELIDKFRSVIRNTKDEKARTRLEDEIFILESDDLKTAEYFSTSPYGFRMEAQKANMVSFMGKDFGPEDARNKLGKFYDYQHDLAHYAVEEFRVGMWRLEKEEELKKAGKTWSGAEEKELSDKIREAHSGYLQVYEKLKLVTDPELIDNPMQQRGGFAEIMDRNVGIRRGVAGAAGWLKGELKALDNGWSTKDMAFLGAVGAFEETIESIRNYGSDNDKIGLEEFAEDFKTLREKCWNKRIENNADKKEICDAVMAFTEKHKDKTFTCTARDSYDTLLRISTALSKEAAKTEAKDNEMRCLREKDPIGYLKKLEASGDIKAFAMALVDVEARVATGDLKEEQINAYMEYSYALTAADDNGQPVKGWDFITNLNKELVRYNLEQGVYVAQEYEKTAKAIRDGRHEYSGQFGDYEKDYAFSNNLAHSYVSKSNASQPFLASKQLITGLQMTFSMQLKDGKPWDTRAEGEKLRNEFHKNAKDGLTQKQREKYVEVANSEPVKFEQQYGFKFAKNGNLIMLNEDTLKDKAREGLEKAAAETAEYTETAFSGLEEADSKLQRLKALKDYKQDNSKEFTAMYEALEAVTRINGHSTPEEIENLYLDLDKASKAYRKAKREDSWFAGRRGNGLERVQMADEISIFAQEQYENIWKKHTVNIDSKADLTSQVHDTSIRLQSFREAAAAQNAPVNEVPVINAPVNDQPVNNGHVNEVPQNANEHNAPKHANNNQRRKMDIKEVRNMLKGDAEKVTGRKSVGSAPKNEEMKNNAGPGAKDSRKSTL